MIATLPESFTAWSATRNRDKVAAGRIDSVCDRGERPPASKENTLPTRTLFGGSALRRGGEPPEVPLERDLSQLIDRRVRGDQVHPVVAERGRVRDRTRIRDHPRHVIDRSLGDQLVDAERRIADLHGHDPLCVHGRAASRLHPVTLAVQDGSEFVFRGPLHRLGLGRCVT